MVPVTFVLRKSLGRIALESLPLGIGLGLAILLLLAQVGCSGQAGTEGGGGTGGDDGPQMVLDPTADMNGHYAFGQLPWPNDLYRDATGHLAVGAIPKLAGSNYGAALIDGLSDLDGFGVTTGVFLAFDKDLDASTVTAQSAYLVTLDGADRGKQVPVTFHFDSAAHQLAALPAFGSVLTEKTRYAFVLTSDAKGTNGKTARQSAALHDALTGQGPAAEVYAPLVSWLSDQQLDVSHIAGATVFTTQSITSDLVQARALVWAGAAPAAHLVRTFPDAQTTLDQLLGTPVADRPGLDNASTTSGLYGIAHSHIGKVVYGTVDVASFNTDSPGQGGKFVYDAQGNLKVQGTTTVPFTLILPATPSAHLPVVIFTHSIQYSRVQAFGVANTLAGAGFAVLASDLPFHGQRNPIGHDLKNNLTGEMTPDGINDDSGLLTASMFFGITANGPLTPIHPALVRDNLRQGAIEQIALARLVAQGDWSAIDPTLAFDGNNVYSVAEGLGTFVAIEAVAVEPTFRASVLSVAGGGLLFPTLFDSPSFSPQFTPIVLSTLSLGANDVDWAGFHPMYQPLVNIFQTVTDRGDPLAWAPYAIHKPVSGRTVPNLLVTEAFADEALPNESSESLAAAIGVPSVPVGGHTPNLRYVAADAMMTAIAPVRSNMSGATAGFVQYDPSPGSLLLKQSGEHDWMPDFPPFVALPQPQMLQNPIEQTQAQMLRFLTSLRDQGAAVIVDPYTNE